MCELSPGVGCLVLHSQLIRVCQGRHCAHDAKCNRYYTTNGA